TKIYIVRHGETNWNIEGRMQGWLDIPLNEAGLKQTQAVALALVGRGIDRIYSSDLSRAADTAKEIGRVLDLPVDLEPGFRERHCGIGQGLTLAELAEKFPQVAHQFLQGGPDYAIPEGESIRQRHDRCKAALETVSARHPGQTILIVAHGGTLSSIFNFVLALAPDTPRHHSLFNGSINRVSVKNGHWQLDTWGEILHQSHLPEPGSLQKYV
ncbi:MAG: histidine phosphatase family protein, partial [Sedimentisphaerales bacterium]|nr:histidine phosphatase family protein [Sedimentisphaerales bacterium]